MSTSRLLRKKSERKVDSDAPYRQGELIGRRVVFIRDNQFVKPPRKRRAAG